jgi:hypothetical protein
MDAAQRPGQTPPKSEAKGMRTRRLVFPAKAGKKPNQCGDKEAEQKNQIWETTRWAFHDVRY